MKAFLRTAARAAILVSLSTTNGWPAVAQSIAPITGNARVDRLLAKMTLEEKMALIHDGPEDAASYQGQAGYIAGVPRLDVPALRMADGPPGVLTRQPSQALTATMGVSATFDVRLARQNGLVIGREARALGIDVALQPYVNIDRDLSFKRAYNTFGEDPLLTAEMGSAEIRGIQSQGVMAMAKHFVGFDTGATNVWIDDQALHEIYLPPFEAAISADVAAIMCAYNHVNGPYACGNVAKLQGILRGELGFKGFVTSDWGANHSALFMNAGLDVEMIDGPDSSGQLTPAFMDARAAGAPIAPDQKGEEFGDLYGGQLPEEDAPAPPDSSDTGAPAAPLTLLDALKNGSVSQATITRAAGDVLLAMDRLGLLTGGSKHSITAQSVAANAKIIEKTAIEGAVLLKNETNALPLRSKDLGSVVLIGPTAGQVDAIGIAGERSQGLIERQVGPVQALKSLSRNNHIAYAIADDMTGTPVPASLFSHAGHPGLEREMLGVKSVDEEVDFTAQNKSALPADSRATWRGTLTISEAGTYWLYLQALGDNAGLYIDGQRVAVTGAYQGDVHGDVLQPSQDNVAPTTDGLDNVRRAVMLTAGDHTIKVTISPDTSHASAQVRLNWYTPNQREQDHAAAVAAARKAKTAIVFAWARRAPAFKLPGDQNRLIEEVAAVNPNTIVVLNTSQPVALPWVDKVKAILQMWWPGDEGGWATAKLLLGQNSPAGRLPVTWGRGLSDYPATDPRFPERSGAGVDQKTTFSEGVDVGYRWFDKQRIAPLFPFGHGLSYTHFRYSNLKVREAPDGGFDVTFRIRNVGKAMGDEAPQVYLDAPLDRPAGIEFPVRKLVAFDRVTFRAGQAKTVRLHVPLRQRQYWSSALKAWATPTGERWVRVGASSRDLRLQTAIDAKRVLALRRLRALQ